MKLLIAAAVAALALAGIAAPAQARDTTWSCPTCVTHR